jgi:hypothetical protein
VGGFFDLVQPGSVAEVEELFDLCRRNAKPLSEAGFLYPRGLEGSIQ